MDTYTLTDAVVDTVETETNSAKDMYTDRDLQWTWTRAWTLTWPEMDMVTNTATDTDTNKETASEPDTDTDTDTYAQTWKRTRTLTTEAAKTIASAIYSWIMTWLLQFSPRWHIRFQPGPPPACSEYHSTCCGSKVSLRSYHACSVWVALASRLWQNKFQDSYHHSQGATV